MSGYFLQFAPLLTGSLFWPGDLDLLGKKFVLDSCTCIWSWRFENSTIIAANLHPWIIVDPTNILLTIKLHDSQSRHLIQHVQPTKDETPKQLITFQFIQDRQFYNSKELTLNSVLSTWDWTHPFPEISQQIIYYCFQICPFIQGVNKDILRLRNSSRQPANNTTVQANKSTYFQQSWPLQMVICSLGPINSWSKIENISLLVFNLDKERHHVSA